MVKLRGVVVRGFKGLDVVLRLHGQVVLIVAPGPWGKSSLLEALGLLMQSRGEEWINLEGRFLVIHDLNDVISGDHVRIGVAFQVDEDGIRLGRTVGLTLTESSLVGYEYEFTQNYSVRQRVFLNGSCLVVAEKIDDEGYITYPLRAKLCMPPTHVMSEDALMVCDKEDPAREARSLLFTLRNMLKDKFFLLRENRACSWKRTFEPVVDLPRYSVGSEGQYTVHQLAIMMARPEYERELTLVKDMLRELGVEDLKAGFTESNRVSGYVKVRGTWVPMYHCSLRLRSMLPVITQLAISPPNSVILIDGIDVGLDAGSLESAMSLITEWSSKRGVQVIATSRLSTGAGEIVELPARP